MTPSPESPASPESVTREFTIVVEAPPARVWEALLSPEYTTEWWFANTVESSWEAGAPVTYLDEDGLASVAGVVLECSPPEHLATTFRPVWSEEAARHVETRVDWMLTVADGAADPESTRVRLRHSGLVPGSVLDHETAPGWEYLLESLKALAER
ncbi:SRPBCC domain-containing protein [Herbiconiux sp. 11R-BC]|uniref:SRPBCC domain-containing protein n=1 Tax=Herbiconiux sp. 11R-BC TaxID=3111637 RepID=UPI003C0BCFFE